MKKIETKNKIFLSGGGDEKQSLLLDKFFFDALPNNASFLYIPIALLGHKLFQTASIWMQSIIDLHKRGDISFDTILDKSELKTKDLAHFDAIYIGGGNTWTLIKELREIGFFEILTQYKKNGGQIYGGSAGAIILGKRIDTHDDKNDNQVNDILGFNILFGYSITCHFKDDDDRFLSWSKENSSPIICLPEEAGLIIENNIAFCVGTKKSTICYPDGDIKYVQPNECFSL